MKVPDMGNGGLLMMMILFLWLSLPPSPLRAPLLLLPPQLLLCVAALPALGLGTIPGGVLGLRVGLIGLRTDGAEA